LGAAEFARDAPALAGDHSKRLADAKRLRKRAGTKSSGSSAKACIRRIEDVAWRHASIIKDAAGLHTALAELGNLKEDIGQGLQGETAFHSIEAQNLLLTAEAIVRASLQRSETRGTHRRSDFPQADVSLARQHTSVRLVNGEMTASFVACRS
jgi:succinate dehydrogenase/fumarate reductase flavoprotein subunit